MGMPLSLHPIRSHIVTMVMLVLLLSLGGVSYYFFTQNQRAQLLLKNPTEAAKMEVKEITGRVGVLLELPSGEEPTVATIFDREKLKDQPFFARAENGDKVIIYTQAKKAILYRPKTNKIIDIAPLTIGPSAVVRIALYNGTNKKGMTAVMEQQLAGSVPNVSIAAKENAARVDYEKTLVVDLVGTRGSEAAQLAQLVGGEAAALPAGEAKPQASDAPADFLIIIGKDYTPPQAPNPTPTPTEK